jgi:hypothetical protein
MFIALLKILWTQDSLNLVKRQALIERVRPFKFIFSISTSLAPMIAPWRTKNRHPQSRSYKAPRSVGGSPFVPERPKGTSLKALFANIERPEPFTPGINLFDIRT